MHNQSDEDNEPLDFDEWFEALDPQTKYLVDSAIRYGLAYRAYSQDIMEAMIMYELPIDLITDEIERQLWEMPSTSKH